MQDLKQTKPRLIFCLALLTICISSLAACNDSDPEADKKNRYQPDNPLSADNLANKDAEVLGETTGIAFEKDITKLISLSMTLTERAPKVSFQKMVTDLDTQQRISERLFELNLNEEQRFFAVHIAVDSMLQLHAMSDLKARERLLALIDKHDEDSNQEIQQEVLIASAIVRIDDYLRIEGNKFDRVQPLLDELLKKFPESKLVAQELGKQIEKLMGRNRRTQAISMMEQMANVYSRSSDKDIKEISGFLFDRSYVAKIKFDVAAREFAEGRTGSREKFLSLIKQLTARRNIGTQIYNSILAAQLELESTNQYDEATMILDEIEKNAPNYRADIQEYAKNDVLMGRSRLALLDKPFELVGVSAAGQKIVSTDMKGKVVALIFWSATKPASVGTLQQLTQIYQRYHSAGLEIIGVCVDNDSAGAAAIFRDQPPPWITVYRHEDKELDDLKKFGVQRVPYLMLVDRNGVLRDLNPPLVQLSLGIEKLLKETP